MVDNEKKKEIVSVFIDKGVLLNPDFLEKMPEDLDVEKTVSLLSRLKEEEVSVLNNELMAALSDGKSGYNWQDLERSLVDFEKKRDGKVYNQFIGYLKEDQNNHPAVANSMPVRDEASQEGKNLGGGVIAPSNPPINNQIPSDGSSVKVLFSYKGESKKRDIQDFVTYFNHRYKAIEKMLRNRQEMQGLMSISRVKAKREKENVCIIGMVLDKQESKNGNMMVTLEDPTGSITVCISKNKPELFDKAKSLVDDEVIGVVGVASREIMFASNVLWPDVPIHKVVKKSNDDVYAVFVSDFHIGSDHFLEEEFNKFIDWLNGSMGSDEQKEIASKIRYLFIIGDIVDGCGIYPEQDKELSIKDIYKQYEEAARYLKKIPPSINIILCAGNHDAMRISEPQPEMYKDFSGALHELKNITFVSNPGLVNIHSSPDFPGFDVLMYHGYSFDYYVDSVDELRNNGGYTRADLIMKFLLQRRHLAPSHKSTLYIPDTESDPLVIERIPDFFVTGHIHYSIAATYHNITTICCSCWQKKTPFQEKMGHNPQPARVPIVNLKTRKVKILKFGRDQQND